MFMYRRVTRDKQRRVIDRTTHVHNIIRVLNYSSPAVCFPMAVIDIESLQKIFVYYIIYVYLIRTIRTVSISTRLNIFAL